MSPHPWCHLDAPELDRLDLASVLVRQVFGEPPYLVGSCLTTPEYRDVDVRSILTDEHYARLFTEGRDALRHLVQVALSDHYVKATGLRIDYQVQSMTDANRRYPDGARHPLGMYLRSDRGTSPGFGPSVAAPQPDEGGTVEALARVLHAHKSDRPWEALPEHAREHFRDYARVAAAAIRAGQVDGVRAVGAGAFAWAVQDRHGFWTLHGDIANAQAVTGTIYPLHKGAALGDA